MLPTGLYEQIISKALDRELAISDKRSQTAPIDDAEAAKVLAKYVADIVERGLENVKDKPAQESGLHRQAERLPKWQNGGQRKHEGVKMG